MLVLMSKQQGDKEGKIRGGERAMALDYVGEGGPVESWEDGWSSSRHTRTQKPLSFIPSDGAGGDQINCHKCVSYEGRILCNLITTERESERTLNVGKMVVVICGAVVLLATPDEGRRRKST